MHHNKVSDNFFYTLNNSTLSPLVATATLVYIQPTPFLGICMLNM